MTKRDWLHIAAIGGLITTICVGSYASPWIAALARGQPDSASKTQRPAPQQESADNATSKSDIEPPPRADENRDGQTECNDLCAQLRMAEAAESQSNFSLIGIILLGATLGFTGWAAWSARMAAIATHKTVDTMEDTAKRQLRAYIDILEITKIEPIGTPPERISAKIKIRNAGLTPAKKMFSCLEFGVADSVEHKLPGVTVMGPGIERDAEIWTPTLPEWTIHEVILGARPIFLWGTIHYTDVFDAPQTLTLGYTIRKTADGWQVRPEDEGNDCT